MVKQTERRIEASDVIPMFPTLVWKILLEAELRSAIDVKILAALEGIRRGLPRLEAARAGSRNKRCTHARSSSIWRITPAWVLGS